MPSSTFAPTPYRSILTVTDVQQIIDRLRLDLLTTNVPAWTETPANTFVSPVDVDGRFFKLACVRVSQTRLQITVSDTTGVLIGQAIDIPASGECRIFSSSAHLVIQQHISGTTYEVFRCFMLDQSPEAGNAHNAWLVVYSSRDGSGNVQGGQTQGGRFFLRDSDGVIQRSRGVCLTWSPDTAGELKTSGGSFIDIPLMIHRYQTHTYVGRAYNVAVVDKSFPTGSIVEIPIDQGIRKQFEILQLDRLRSGSSSGQIAVRIQA